VTTYQTISAGLSATGSDLEKAAKNAELALKVSPTNPRTAVQVAASLEDVRKMTGMDAESNLGYMLEVGRRAVSRKQEFVAGYLVPAAKKLTSYGASPEEAGAVVTAVQGAIGERDTEGRITGTAVVQLAKQLEEKYPEEDRYKTDVEGVKTLIAKRTGMKTFTERLRFMQANEEERERFMSEASFEAGAEIEIQQLLGARVAGRGGAGNAKDLYERNLREFAPRAQWGKIGLGIVGRVGKPPEQQIADLDRRVKTSIEGLQGTTQGREAALAGVLSKENMEKMLSASGADFFGLKAENIAFTGSELLSGAAITRFEAAMDRTAKQLETRNRVIAAMYGGARISEPETDPKRLEVAKRLREATAKIVDQARRAYADLQAPPAETPPPATVPPTLGPAPPAIPPQLPAPLLLPPIRKDPRRGQTWDKAMDERDPFSAEFEKSLRNPRARRPAAAFTFEDAAAAMRGFGPAPPAKPVGEPTASVDFGAAVREFRVATSSFLAASGMIRDAARRSPTLGNGEDV
jgi:hypothetical protein